MSDLKTFKDLEREEPEEPTGRKIVFADDLKEEAIRWIKRLQEEKKGEHEWNFFYHDENAEEPTIRFLKWKFDIIEEDLKDNVVTLKKRSFPGRLAYLKEQYDNGTINEEQYKFQIIFATEDL